MESLRGLGNALSDAGKKEVRDDTSGASSFVVFDQQRRPSMDVQTAQTNGQPRQHAAPRRNMSYDASTFSAREPGRKPPWTLAEEASLAKWHSILGNRWAAISKYLPGRSENDVKNMWHSTVRAKSCRRSSLLFNYCRAVKDCSDDATARRAAFERTQQQCAGSPIPSPGVGGGAGVGGTLAAGGAGGGAGGPVRMLPTKRSSAPGAQQLLGLYAAQSPSGLLRAGQALLERPFSGSVTDQLDSGILGSEPLDPAGGHDSMTHLDYSPAAGGGASRRPRAATATGLGLSGTCETTLYHHNDHRGGGGPGDGGLGGVLSSGTLSGGAGGPGGGGLGDGGGGQSREAFQLLHHGSRPTSFNGVASGSHSPQQLGYSRMGLQHQQQQQQQQQQLQQAAAVGHGGIVGLDRAASMPHRTSLPGSTGLLGVPDYGRRVDGAAYDAGPNSGGSAALGGYAGSQSGYAASQYGQHPSQQQQQLLQMQAAQQQQQQQQLYASNQMQLQQQGGRYDSGGSAHGGPSRLTHMVLNAGDGSQHGGLGPRSSQDLSPHHNQQQHQAYHYQQQQQQQLTYAQQQQQGQQQQPHFEFHQHHQVPPQHQYGGGYMPAPQHTQQQQSYGMHPQHPQQQQQQHRTSINGGMSLMSIDTDTRTGPDGPHYRTNLNAGGGAPVGPDAAAYAEAQYQQQLLQQQQYYQQQQYPPYQQQPQRPSSGTVSAAGLMSSGGGGGGGAGVGGFGGGNGGGYDGRPGHSDNGYGDAGSPHGGPDSRITTGGGVGSDGAPGPQYGASARQSRPSSGPRQEAVVGDDGGGPDGADAVHTEQQQQQQQQARAMAIMAIAAASGSQRGSQRGRAMSGTSNAFDELDALLEQIDVMEDNEALTLNYLAVAGGSNRGAAAAQHAAAAAGSAGGMDGGHFDLQPQPRYQQQQQQQEPQQQYLFSGLAPPAQQQHEHLQDGPSSGAAGHVPGTGMLFGGGAGAGGPGGPGGPGGCGLLGSATFSALLMNVDGGAAGAGGRGNMAPAGPPPAIAGGPPGGQRAGSMTSQRHHASMDVVTMGLGDEDIAGMMAALAGSRGQGGQGPAGGVGGR